MRPPAARHLGLRSVASALALGALVATWTALADAEGPQVRAALVGTWSSTQAVTVRLLDERGGFRYVSGTVRIQLVIGPDGQVDGAIGGARLQACSVSKNRGWFGRLLGLWTDHLVDGTLAGALFEKDTQGDKPFRIPFDLEGGIIRGTLFQRQGSGVFPMAKLQLSKG
jgi:hypothetical protein